MGIQQQPLQADKHEWAKCSCTPQAQEDWAIEAESRFQDCASGTGRDDEGVSIR
jgi:hypothetical protein